MFKSEVFDRVSSEDSIISARLYNLIIGITLLWGFGINWYMVTNISTEAVASINPLIFLIGYFVSCIIGTLLFNGSSNPIVSFIGYNMVVLPFGFVLNIFLAGVNPDIVVESIQLTFLVTGVMMVLGTLFPKFFIKIAPALFIALLAAIVIELIMIFVYGQSFKVMDFIVALIFCGYIGVDWARANAIPKTVDNAIDSAAALYIDIINLFVRIVASKRN